MNSSNQYSTEERQLLHKIARDSVQSGLQQKQALQLTLADYSPQLQAQRASFVTLNSNHHLRGCIGSLVAHRPLVVDIAQNAYAAAFSDPRFPPLSQPEFKQLDYHISVLSETSEMQFTSEQDLLAQIRPGIDGLILSEHHHQGTFLPSVWEQLPEVEAFLRHLKQKAGLAADYWSDKLQVKRYTVESF